MCNKIETNCSRTIVYFEVLGKCCGTRGETQQGQVLGNYPHESSVNRAKILFDNHNDKKIKDHLKLKNGIN